MTIKGDSDLIAYLRNRVFEPLKKNGDISDYQVKKELNDYWIYFRRSDRKYQIHQENLKSLEEKKTGSKDSKLKSRQR